MVNGILGREIACRRGLSQGNLLSPLLFTLVADGLHAIIQRAREENLIRRLPIPKLDSCHKLAICGRHDVIWTSGYLGGNHVEVDITFF